MVECDSDLIVMFACADKCCDATHGFNWVVDLRASFHATSEGDS